jgi:hypothetical protein
MIESFIRMICLYCVLSLNTQSIWIYGMLGTSSGRPSWAFTLFGMKKWHHRKDSKKSQYLSCEIIFMKSYLWKAYLFLSLQDFDRRDFSVFEDFL